ncbi:tectonin beta-propeller repeat-containing protein 2 isoform X1 [Heterocephalus glaber]|uniref:Tectonin beta-propeller repeat-containing protein 2 isoform X1 n=1 Tax=Heterocephalus glaber TaxID=10181 RepID=A0AAX6RWB9_HETGA|nr:tectonin beta-propeller repeat-containing protein 2 isoform X1 [Heterocephalus glaber]XP_004836974.1 tectonin beta-propeller repeat-containing protein 2 isoform X1 [Heterocephalus glaber]XP_004836975.1 tectonin beta-propeller repeat-containing protein 2 isoform X1 [Heterocephalus glaber]XP_004836976.1 tectonin beta-propeller repeat-containing protein 2 isoform X1 [Heterocephalus glaber]XP_021099640.1 tectonin beta-propeller repeat-containing protein 2 isoform X1 [Heterocephalus glaber]XP_02
MASMPDPVTFREFCPLYHLLNAIPAKVQKGFRSLVVYLTALDANGDYIAVGSSIGMLYLYCRRLSHMRKYNFEGKTEPITVVKLLSCFDDLVAAGTASGRVAVFQLVSALPGRNKQLRRFDVTGVHRNSITALAWSPNGMKLFSGDDRGKIVYSFLDLDQGLCNSLLVLEEPASIVQLDYSQKVLLVSTLQRSLLFYTEERSVRQIGTQARKSTGKFGACFIPGLCKQSDLTLYASRPGLRLWKADAHGTVQATFILKDVFAGGVTPFELYPRVEPEDRGGCGSPEKHLGLVSCFFREGWVLSWNEYSIYLLDTVSQATIAGLEGSGDIVSVSCTENEIFFLKGDRNIIRISSRPEGLASVARDGLEVVRRPEHVHAQCPEKPPGVAALETKLRGSSLASSAASEPRSRSSSLASTDSGSSLLPPEPPAAPEPSKGGQPTQQRFSAISLEDFEQELVVKPIRVKRRRRKKKPEGRSSDAGPSSLELTPCSELSGGSPRSLSIDQLSVASSILGSSVDQLSTESPDRETSLGGSEVNGVLLENNDAETFSVLEVPESVPDVLDEDDVATELPQCHLACKLAPLPGVLMLPLLPRDGVEGGSDQGHKEHPVPVNTEPSPGRVLCPGQASSVQTPEGEDVEAKGPQSPSPEPPLLDLLMATPSSSCAPAAAQWLSEILTIEGTERASKEQDGPDHLSADPWPAVSDSDTGEKEMATSKGDRGGEGTLVTPLMTSSAVSTHEPWLEPPSQDPGLTSSDEEDIYAHGLPSSSSETSVTELRAGCSLQDLSQPGTDDPTLLKSDQFAESWMGYSGPGYGILSLAVSEKYVWCLDYKGGLFCSALPGAGLRWQKFEDTVQQVAVSPSGALLWKIEQKSNRAFACGKVTIKGKRHWYEALPQAVFVSLSDDTAWIIRTNGDVYLQTGLSVDRPCARAGKVDCPYPLAQIAARNCVVWALTEQRALLYREGVSSFCPEGEQWTCDIVSEKQALEPVCITLGDQHTLWALDIRGKLWFRTGVVPKKPQGDDDHWWQVSITDYVVFDQCSLFQTIIHATHSVATAAQAPVEKVADKLRMAFWSQQLQCQPSLLGVNSSGVWISSGKNEFHVAKGSLIGTYWSNVVPRGTASATKWAFVLASAAPTKEGSSLWLCQSSKDLCSVSAQSVQCRPSTVQLPPDAEMCAYAACQDALWALDSLGQVFIRTLSKSCPTGMHWTKLDLSQLGAVKLTSLACGNQHIWACDSRGGVYFRVGTQPLNPSLMLPAWITIEPPVQPTGVTLVSVHASPNDQMLWALDSRWNVHVRTGITEEMPVGTDWEHVPGLQACQLALSTRTVWARCPNGDLARRYGVTDKNPAGDYWKKTPGNALCFTVTSSDELWAVGPPGRLLQRLTRTFSHAHGTLRSSQAATPHPEDLEDEWEVI